MSLPYATVCLLPKPSYTPVMCEHSALAKLKRQTSCPAVMKKRLHDECSQKVPALRVILFGSKAQNLSCGYNFRYT